MKSAIVTESFWKRLLISRKDNIAGARSENTLLFRLIITVFFCHQISMF